MNINSFKYIFQKKLRQFFHVILVIGLCMFSSVGPVWATTTISIVDTLGVAIPDTQFSVFGTDGSIVGPTFIGPKFTLAQPTTLTDIGGFHNNCRSFSLGVPQCPTTLPFVVQIRPAIDDVPHPSIILGSFVLSHDNNPFIVSYESVATSLTLPAGTYFALFGPQNNDEGFLLAGANNPFDYRADSVEIGVFLPSFGGLSSSPPIRSAAVRILGKRNVFIDGCDSGVDDIVLSGGATISDLIAECGADATNRGQFRSCVSHVTNNLKGTGAITGQQKAAIQKCAAQADIP